MANCIAKIAMQNAHAGRLAEADEDLAAETGDSVVATAADIAQAISINSLIRKTLPAWRWESFVIMVYLCYTHMNKKIIVLGIAVIALAALIAGGIYVWLVMI